MSFNLLNEAKSFITPDFISKSSSYLDENPGNVSKAISGILPSLIGGLHDKTSTYDGTNAVVDLIKNQTASGIKPGIVSSFQNDDLGFSKGMGILQTLFGDKVNDLTNLISNFSGVKSSSALSLLSMSAPLVLGILGKHINDNNLNTTSISALLSKQKNDAAVAVPAGLHLGSLFAGWQNKASAAVHNSTKYVATETKAIAERTGGGLRWLLPLLGLILLAAFAWYFLGKGCNKTMDTVANGVDSLSNKVATVAQGAVDSISGDFVYNMGDTVTINLPNNAGTLVVGEFSTENKLYKFLNDPNSTIDTVNGNWFEFTNTHFKTASSELDSASMIELKNITAITKAFPTAQFKIGGYTDTTGDSTFNVALSQKRADAVLSELETLGTATTALTEAKGYGPLYPIGDNATVIGKALNRRVALNVKAK